MPAADLLRDLLAAGPCERADAPYRLLQLTGPEAGEFLHRLCTQDVLGLRPGELRPAAFLDAKGKLVGTCLVGRLDDTFWLEAPAAQADRLAALLERYHFTEKLTILALPAGAGCWERVGIGEGGQAGGNVSRHGDAVQIRFARRGIRFERCHGQPWPVGEVARAAPPLAADLAECVRMVAGLVRVGLETEPTTLALEADLDDHISTTKGCYTGQEIVARIHTYGHTNRKLCLLQLGPGAPIGAPQPLHETEDQLAVGRVMHAVPIPGRTERLGVGYLPKDFQALGTKLALADGSAVEVIGYEPLPGSAAADGLPA